MDNTFYTPRDNINNIQNNDSENEYITSEEEEEGNIITKHFSNMVKTKRYEKYRNKLFTPDLVKKKIVVDSHNYFQADKNFNTSNFDVLFDFERKSGDSSSSLVTTNYDIYNNVVGFKLLKTTIRTPPYNINKTNNIIRYKIDGSDQIHKVVINPGQYEVGELAEVFQSYNNRYQANTGNTNSNIKSQFSQYVEYSDVNIVMGDDYEANTNIGTADVNITPNTFRVSFLQTDETNLGLPSSEINRPLKGLINKFEYFSDSIPPKNVTILWDYDNISRGAARLFGFLPKETKTEIIGGDENDIGGVPTLFSNRLLDVSSHFVDLVIPEIPSIACKRNSSGRDIIERIQLRAGHGEYLHYRTAESDLSPVYFNPMKLHRINIQLWAQNNELYDTNNSDVSFEFEITMLKNIDLLR